jgi:hypothetical protein
MRFLRSLAALLLCLSVPAPALAQQTIELSPAAQQQFDDQRAAEPEAGPESGFDIRSLGNGQGEGVSYHKGGVYFGSYRRSTSPVTGRLTYWVFDDGVFSRPNGDRYVGRFLYFHAVHDEAEKVRSDLPHDGTYLMVGRFIAKDGTTRQGIYYNLMFPGMPMRWIEADETFLREIEASNRQQVAYVKEQIRQEQAEAESGLSFGQILALGLGAAVIGTADIPSADALQIGSAFASDVLSGGETNALNQLIADQQSAAAAAAGATASGLGPNGDVAATATYQNDQVTVSCPSGVSSVIPVSYKTAACRDAMVTFAKVYSCNMIDDFSSAAAACQNACGDPQCRQ